MLIRLVSIHVMVISISSAIAGGLLCSLKDFSAPFWLWVILEVFWCSQPTEWDKGEDFADFHDEKCNKKHRYLKNKKQLKAFVALHILAPTIIHNTILMNGSLKNGSWEWEFDDGIWSFRIHQVCLKFHPGKHKRSWSRWWTFVIFHRPRSPHHQIHQKVVWETSVA